MHNRNSMHAGMMEKIAEDMGKLPKSNKVASRRFILEVVQCISNECLIWRISDDVFSTFLPRNAPILRIRSVNFRST
jgi:hypothetical protein